MSFSFDNVAKGMNAQHREVDYVDEDGQADSPPYMGSMGMPNLPQAEEWSNEVADMNKRLEEIDSRRNEIEEQAISIKNINRHLSEMDEDLSSENSTGKIVSQQDYEEWVQGMWRLKDGGDDVYIFRNDMLHHEYAWFNEQRSVFLYIAFCSITDGVVKIRADEEPVADRAFFCNSPTKVKKIERVNRDEMLLDRKRYQRVK